MPLIENDKKKMYEIASKRYCMGNREKYFRESEADSYYLRPSVEPEMYLQEYEFQTPMELKAILEKLFAEKEISMEYLQPVMVMMLKLQESVNQKEVLMETIYNF